MTQDYPIVTVEQDDFIKKILKVKTGFMKHKQVGEILCLANELGNKEYKEALKFIENYTFYQDAESYKNQLISGLLKKYNLL